MFRFEIIPIVVIIEANMTPEFISNNEILSNN